MSTYIRLTEYKSSDSKEQGFFKPENRYIAKQSDFEKIPGSPIAFWISKKTIDIFRNNDVLGKETAEVITGMTIGKNDLYLRMWFEVNINNTNLYIGDMSNIDLNMNPWIPYNKGGERRKWYGNNEYLVNWSQSDNFNRAKTTLQHLYLKEGLTWNFLTSSGKFSMRYFPNGFLWDVAGSPCFVDKKNINYVLGLMLTRFATNFLNLMNPTLNFQAVEIANIPVIFPKQESIKQQIDTLTQECIDISKEDWDSRETSWDFRINELIRIKNEELRMKNGKIEDVYNAYCNYWKEKFYKLHSNEEELNRLFIDIYELQDEITPDVDLNDITILKQETSINDSGELEFDSSEIMKQFISYAVGVMFGRYSLDSDGLVVANLNQELPKDSSYEIDDDNVIPVLEDDYFSDDISSRIINFVKTTFGTESLSANINFIEKCLGKTIRNYMVKDFYEDHIKRYKKRPIYWMVSSPKKGFMSLSYMHRYQSDIFARVQNNYLREYIAKLEGTKEILNQTLLSDTASSKDKKEADKKIKAIEVKLKELIAFDRDTLTNFAQNRVGIDLDDGVKVNYCKFSDVLYEIKGLC